MKNLILIKLGGSAITHKNKVKSANLKIIRQLAKEISMAQTKTKDLLIIGHGQGSFAHIPAAKYKTKDGMVNKNSPLGLTLVRKECIELNNIILKELLDAQIPAFCIEAHSTITTKNKKLKTIFIEPYLNALKFGLVPVVYGDTPTDEKIGWTIFSTEQILNILATKLKKTYKPKLIVEVGLTEGVLNKNKKTIARINKSNYPTVQNLIGKSEAKDVTGGMSHKVEEALKLASSGIPTIIISSKAGNLEKVILGQKVSGTLITNKP